jgi:hypothetical protein
MFDMRSLVLRIYARLAFCILLSGAVAVIVGLKVHRSHSTPSPRPVADARLGR